jgi:ankyrin repeat protein
VLISAGANVNASNEAGETPLFHAPNAELATIYLDSGADINHRDTFGCTALHTAVSNAAYNSTEIEVIECLLEHGAVVDAQDDDGKTSLQCAVEDSDDRIVRILLAYGADPVPLFAPIYECCSSGQIDFGFSAAETKALMLEAGYSDGDVRSMFDKYGRQESGHGN